LLDRLISTGVVPLTANLLEEYLGCPNSEKVTGLIAAIGDSDAPGALAAAGELSNAGLTEVQIADALVEYMRDLMVIKAAGAKSELVILTEQQRQRAGQLAEKFDVAGLVYNITTLEKLRWSLKNSESARPLLEATILRLALSEHFLNVDQLLSQSNPQQDKKKVTTEHHKPAIDEPQPPGQGRLPLISEIDSIKNHWQDIIKALGPGTAGLLSCAEPIRLSNNTLTLEFPASSAVQKQMCESNGRLEQIKSVLQKKIGSPVDINLRVAEAALAGQSQQDNTKTKSQRQNEILNDPAVKAVIMGLDATITNIEDTQ
jgi:DNA polymerase III gamma/tau subunit